MKKQIHNQSDLNSGSEVLTDCYNTVEPEISKAHRSAHKATHKTKSVKHKQNLCDILAHSCKSFFSNFKSFFVTNFTIYHEILPMVNKLEQIEQHMLEIRIELEAEIDMITKELDMYKTIVETMTKELPDMFWLKLKDGTYKIANDEIKNKLLLDDNPFGKNDVELAMAAKERYGDENHTFGEKCANSDEVGTESMQRQRFLESGKVKGKMLHLEVYKAPLIINGEFVGVFGAGRDMTEYVEAYLEQRAMMEKHFPGITTKFDNIFAKYSFQSDEVHAGQI